VVDGRRDGPAGGERGLHLLSGRILGGLLYAAVAALFLTALLAYRSERTVVAPDGIRVKRGLRWRTVAWDGVADVAKPERWTWDRTLRITTQSGEDVRLDVPGALRSDFVACRAPAPSPRHSAHKDAPLGRLRNEGSTLMASVERNVIPVSLIRTGLLNPGPVAVQRR
jgi:hypothetical protein